MYLDYYLMPILQLITNRIKLIKKHSGASLSSYALDIGAKTSTLLLDLDSFRNDFHSSVDPNLNNLELQ